MKKRFMTFCRRTTCVLLTAACVSTLLAGCGQDSEAATQEEEALGVSIPVEVQLPEAGTLTLKNEFVGMVSPEESVYVVPLVAAEVLSTDISVGDIVTAGQVLCKLDTEAAELQLASAKAQYNSAAAGVQAAEVGYEIAQAQYESTVAQLDMQNEQTQRQKDLTMYQMQMQIDGINDGIEDINEQIADLEEDKEDAKEQRDDLSKAKKRADKYVSQARAAYNAAATAYGYDAAMRDYQALIATVTGMESGQIPHTEEELQKAKEELKAAGEKLEEIKANLKPHEETLQAAQAAASQTGAAYDQVDAGIDSIEEGEEKLKDSLSDTYKSKEQTETVKNLTEAQLDVNTQPVQEAGKKTAALGVDSAAAQVNSAKVGAEGAKVAIDSAEYQLDMYTLTAPIDGLIEAVNVKEHDFASSGNPAFVISNKDTMTVTFGVSEGIRNTLRIGQNIEVERNGKNYRAAITEIGSMVDQTTGLFTIKSCVSDPDGSLLTGSSVKVAADTYSQADALLIPYDAVYYDGSQPYVYVAQEDVAKRKDVETGIFDEKTITVLSGLSAEDQLITSWSSNLRDGASISIQETGNAATEAED